jgi:hypothetical protein
VPRYLLINGTEPRWRLHDTVDSTDLEKSLARVVDNDVIIYTLASRNEGETFQSLAINGMQGVRGSNPLSSTRHNASAGLPLRVVCQRFARVSLTASVRTP